MLRIANQARTVSQVAANCNHLPQVYDVADREAGVVWVVAEWVDGVLLDRLLPQDGPLPDAPSLLQLVHWATDACEALSALHRRRLSHGGVSSRTLLVTQGPRGVVLIDPGFVASPGPLAAEPPPFRPSDDVRDLAATLYQVITHQSPQAMAASRFNPSVPSELDDVLSAALSGSLRRADRLKQRLHRVRQAIRR